MKSKHDLSFSTAKINLEELIDAMTAGVVANKILVERSLLELQCASDTRTRKNAARNLAEHSTNLAKTLNSLYFLEESNGRDEIQMIKY